MKINLQLLEAEALRTQHSDHVVAPGVVYQISLSNANVEEPST